MVTVAIKKSAPINDSLLESPSASKLTESAIDSSFEWEEIKQEFTTRAAAVLIYGDTDTGRSTLALTAPGPIAYLHGYEKVDGLIQQASLTKKIKAFKFGGDLRGTPDQVQLLAEQEVRRFERAISDAYRWARSIVVDTESKAWEIYQLARLGTLVREQKSEKDQKKGQLVYTEINNRWSSMLSEFRVRLDNPLQSKQTNLILICKTKDEYKGNQSTGNTIRASQKDSAFFSDVRLRTHQKRGKFMAEIEKPWWNREMRDYEVKGETGLLNFCAIMGLITETDPSEWE